MPLRNARRVDFTDNDEKVGWITGTLLVDTPDSPDGFVDTHHWDVFVDEGFNFDRSIQLGSKMIFFSHNIIYFCFVSIVQRVVLWNNQKPTNDRRWSILIEPTPFKVGYRFVTMLSCSSIWCKINEYNYTTMELGSSTDVWYQKTSTFELFDYGSMFVILSL